MTKRTNKSASIVMSTAHQLWNSRSLRTGNRLHKTFGAALTQAWYFFKTQCGGKVETYLKREKLLALGTPTRAAYEAFCAQEGISPLAEKTLAMEYGLQHGVFGYDRFDMMVHSARARLSRKEYTPEKVVVSAAVIAAAEAYNTFWSEVDGRAAEWA